MSGAPEPQRRSEATCRTGLPSASNINVCRPFRPSEYLEPASVEEAARLLDRYGARARIIAGGTDLLLERDPEIEVLIGVHGLELDVIRVDERGGTIGAAARFAELASTPTLAEQPYRALAQAAMEMGTPQIRNQATIGGNVCSAVSCADSPPPLLVLDATLDVVGPDGERSVAIGDFFEDARTNSLRGGEILRAIQLPELPPRSVTLFVKKGRVRTGDLAVVNLAVRLTLDADGSCSEVRYVGDRVAAVAATHLESAEEALALIDVEYEPLPAVFDIVAAVEPGAPPVNAVRWMGDVELPNRNNTNTADPMEGVPPLTSHHVGDVEEGFRRSDLVVENEFRTGRQHQAPLGRPCCVCRSLSGGRLEVWNHTQGIHPARRCLAATLGIPLSKIVVHHMPMGGPSGPTSTCT
jgi:carbon-monoxide dehydrogenase medium subunit